MRESNPPSSLRHYYQKKKLQVAYRNLKNQEHLDAFVEQRKNFLAQKLSLPVDYFEGKKILEFGPGSGENSMCFAIQGAELTLVEPNLDSHGHIVSYFDQFDLMDSLKLLSSETLESFSQGGVFDFIDAEGFLASVRPEQLWINVIWGHLKPNGLLLMSYFERHGSFFERYINVLGKIITFRHGSNSNAHTLQFNFTKKLMLNKWKSIGSQRSFETWYMDHIISPYSTLNYNFDAVTLVNLLSQHGFLVHSSCPNYLDKVNVDWYKHIPKKEEQAKSCKEFIKRNSLSFMLGRKCFFTGSQSDLITYYKIINKILVGIGNIEEQFEATTILNLEEDLEELIQFVEGSQNNFYMPEHTHVVALLNLIKSGLIMAQQDDKSELVKTLADNVAFMNWWGSPVHYLVLRKSRL
ncbi:class I SAM-dependent methyltransferase [Paracoccaceae bacterium]|nr:class I SAM-dependent methyltransferase [Paracoccaceae bacterium]